MSKIIVTEPEGPYHCLFDTGAMNVEIRNCFNGVMFRTENGEKLGVCMRDNGYEVRYVGPFGDVGWTDFKNGAIKTPKQPSNLVDHARKELSLVETDPWIIEGICNVIQAFADMGHSGGSASIVIPMINDLLQYKNLYPLTDDPAEWNEVGQNMWQNSRNSEAFSTDGGKNYYLISEDGQPSHVSQAKSPDASQTLDLDPPP